MKRILIVACLAVFGLSGSVLAEPATKAGAAELKATLRTYLGGSDWAVQVVPVDKNYTVILDPTALAEGLQLEEFQAGGSTLTLTVADNGDGTWDYALDQPVFLSFEMPDRGPVCMFNIGKVSLSGVFDEVLGLPRQSRLEATEASTQCSNSNPDPRLENLRFDRTAKSWIVESSAIAGTEGVDISILSSTESNFFSITLPIMEQEPWRAKGATARSTAEIAVTGLRSGNLLDLLALVIGHAGLDSTLEDNAGLTTHIEAALPIFSDLAATSTYQGTSVNTPQGVVSAKEITVNVGATGLVADAHVQQGLSITGLTLPEGLLHGSLADLVPQDFSLGIAASDFDFAAMTHVLLSVLDQPFGSPPPQGFEDAVKTSLLPKGTFTLTLAPGFAATPDYRLTYEGSMVINPDLPAPVFTAKLGLSGYAAVRSSLQSAPAEYNLGTAAAILGAFSGLADQGPDGALQWEISLDEAGTVLVNGVDPDKLFKSP